MTFLRFSGMISPTGEFQHHVGWETDHIAHPPEPSGPFEIDQLDERGSVIARTKCQLSPPACGRAGVPMWQDIQAYVPLNDATMKLRLRDGDLARHEVEVSRTRPQLDLPLVNASEGRAAARWNASHKKPLVFNVALFTEPGRVFPLALATRENNIDIDPTSFPGGDQCRIAVVATDGVRSTSILSEPFQLPQQPPVLYLLSPTDGTRFGAFEPIGLNGTAMDRGGLALPDEHLSWHIDGVAVSHGQRLEAVPALAPGPHTIELRYGDAASSVAIEVAEPSELEQRWAARSAELTEHQQRSSG